jgi:hypothetical protein
VTLAGVTHRKLQICLAVYVSENSVEDFIVDGGFEDSSTVLLIQLEQETVEREIVALDTQKGPGPDGISPL